MPHDALSGRLFEALGRIELQDGVLHRSRTASAFSSLCGAATALVACNTLINRFAQSYGPLEAMTCDVSTVAEGFATAIAESPTTEVDWGGSPNACVWSLGFFLNKAEQNLAAAFDKIMNAWLMWKLHISRAHPLSVDDSIFYPYIGTPVRIIELLSPDVTRRAMLERLRRAATEGDILANTRLASDFVQTTSDNIPRAATLPIETALTDLVAVLPTDTVWPEAAVLVMVGRVNDFKHHPDSVGRRTGRMYVAEVAIAAHALVYLAELTQAMMEDTRYAWSMASKPPTPA